MLKSCCANTELKKQCKPGSSDVLSTVILENDVRWKSYTMDKAFALRNCSV